MLSHMMKGNFSLNALDVQDAVQFRVHRSSRCDMMLLIMESVWLSLTALDVQADAQGAHVYRGPDVVR